jgi:hypothetical protein
MEVNIEVRPGSLRTPISFFNNDLRIGSKGSCLRDVFNDPDCFYNPQPVITVCIQWVGLNW